MRVLVIGASGLVGGSIKRYCLANNIPVLGTYFSYVSPDDIFLDLADPKALQNPDISAFRPDVIIHTGALTHVDLCEQDERKSYAGTVASTESAVRLAKHFNTKFVYISTDYVFDGTAGPYTEEAETNPLSVYGKHKLEAEQLVRGAIADALICRITNVYGDELRNKNFVARLVHAREDAGLHLRLPYDQYATPINAADVARAIILLLSDNHSGVFHLASTDFLNRVQLAERVAGEIGALNFQFEAVSTQELAQTAARPLLGGLIAGKFNMLYPHFGWTTLSDYLNSLRSAGLKDNFMK